jgi:hypothetical protein
MTPCNLVKRPSVGSERCRETPNSWDGRVSTGAMNELMGTSAPERDCFLKAEKKHKNEGGAEKGASMATFTEPRCATKTRQSSVSEFSPFPERQEERWHRMAKGLGRSPGCVVCCNTDDNMEYEMTVMNNMKRISFTRKRFTVITSYSSSQFFFNEKLSYPEVFKERHMGRKGEETSLLTR